MKLENVKVGFGITGSFCNFSDIEKLIENLKIEGVETIIPIISYSVQNEQNRFSTPKEYIAKLEEMTGNKVIDTLSKAEPVGPSNLIDVMLITPCTGNTLAKMANSITDTPVLMVSKSHIRNDKPLVVGISTNDALGGNAKNIGLLLNSKNIYFIPFRQDDYIKKPKSLVYDYTKTADTIVEAMKGKQIQPILG